MRRAVAGGVTLVVLLLLIAALASAAADGRGPAVRIAFLRDGDVHVLDAASGAETRLTADGTAARPRWTSDGRTLLFNTRGGTRRP